MGTDPEEPQAGQVGPFLATLSVYLSRHVGTFSCPYSPECMGRLSGNSYARAKRLTISRVIAA